MTDELPIHSEINPAQHPSALRGESPGAKSARHVLGALYVAEGKIRDLHSIVKSKALVQQKAIMASMPKPPDGKRKAAPPLMYDEQAARHIIDVGTPLAQAALKAADVAITSLGEQVVNLDKAIQLKITAGKNPARGPELRAWAARQDHPFQTLGALFQKADENGTLVAEVLGAEPYLSNLSSENQAHLRKAASDVLAPDEVQARNETAAALGHLTAAAKAFTETTAQIFNGLQSPTAAAIDSIVSKGDE